MGEIISQQMKWCGCVEAEIMHFIVKMCDGKYKIVCPVCNKMENYEFGVHNP